jgi:hypothetical protein
LTSKLPGLDVSQSVHNDGNKYRKPLNPMISNDDIERPR